MNVCPGKISWLYISVCIFSFYSEILICVLVVVLFDRSFYLSLVHLRVLPLPVIFFELKFCSHWKVQRICASKLMQFEWTCREIAKHLSLPPVKLHCSMLAEDAIKAAVKDYEAKRAKSVASSEAAAHADKAAQAWCSDAFVWQKNADTCWILCFSYLSPLFFLINNGWYVETGCKIFECFMDM